MFKRLLTIALLTSNLIAGDVEHFQQGTRRDLNQLGFVDQNGKKCFVSDFKGKVVLVDFWTTWCGPCRRSLPELCSFQKQGAQNNSLIVIPCNLDTDAWPLGVSRFVKKNEKVLSDFIYYRPLYGKNGISTNLGKDISAYPTTLLIDRDGMLATMWSGYGEGLALKEINQLLKEK